MSEGGIGRGATRGVEEAAYEAEGGEGRGEKARGKKEAGS